MKEMRVLRRGMGLGVWSTLALLSFGKGQAEGLAWFHDGSLTPCGQALVELLLRADEEGLSSSVYASLLARLRAPTSGIAEKILDDRLSRAFSHYLTWSLGVRPNLLAFDSTTHLKAAKIKVADLITGPLCGQDVAKLTALQPQFPQYARLKSWLSFFLEQKKKGGWPTIQAHQQVRVGDRDADIVRLRLQLEGQGYRLPESEGGSPIFTPELRKVLQVFQVDHDLDPSGLLTEATIGELNTPVEKRIERIRVNLERWRWLPRNLGQRVIVVNIPTYEASLVEDQRVVDTMPIVVGKTTQKTPSFVASMNSLTVNPTWTVPRSLMLKSKIPLFQKNPRAASGYRVLFQGQEVASQGINWKSFSGQSCPYTLTMDPGNRNPLGKIKFSIPNPFSILLHGTNEPQLLKTMIRAFSWGCIRLADPLRLALFVLADPQWTEGRLHQEIERGKTKTISLKKRVPVYVVYFDLWIEEDGRPHFAKDIYGKDAQVLKALDGALAETAQEFQDTVASPEVPEKTPQPVAYTPVEPNPPEARGVSVSAVTP